MRRAAPILAMVVTLGLAYGFDRMLEAARSPALARVSVVGYQWLLVLANLVFAGCVLGLAWLALAPGRRSRWLAALFLGLGLVLVLLPAPPFWSLTYGAAGGVFPLLQASPFSFFGKASAFLAAIGAAGLGMEWRRTASRHANAHLPGKLDEAQPGV